METTRFEDFDPTVYQSIPRLPVTGLVSLTRALLALVPEDSPAHVVEAAKLLKAEVESLEAAVDARRRATSSQTLAAEAELDHFVDGLWLGLRKELEVCLAYDRPGAHRLAALTVEDNAEVDYEPRIARAQRAKQILTRIFGDRGTSFVQDRYRDQAATMASILRIIDEDGLAPDIDEISGPETLEHLRDCQARYEAMVTDRAAREQGQSHNLRELGERMRVRLSFYAINVLSLINPNEPESLALVQASLRPIINYRQRPRPRDGDLAEERVEGDPGEPAATPEAEVAPAAEVEPESENPAPEPA